MQGPVPGYTLMSAKLLNVVETIKFAKIRNKYDTELQEGNVVLGIATDSELDKARAVAEHVLDRLGDIEFPLMMMNLERVSLQLERWRRCLPDVTPYYAVKCNPDETLVGYLQSLGVDFDCATSAEMDLVVNKLGHSADKIVYSNPCKLVSHIRYAAEIGVGLTIIDNMDEVSKIKRNHPTARVLIRLACADSSSQCPMSCKFGVPNDRVFEILEHASQVGLEVVGVHFHVGSGCSDPMTYHRALLDARRAFDLGAELGHEMHVLDLGGGYPPLGLDGTCQTSNGVHFEEMACMIRSLLDQLFPNESGMYKFMAEPGRFLVGGSSTLLTKIHSKCKTDDEHVRYYLNDGLYGCFNCVLYDHQTVVPETLDVVENRRTLNATIFGPTCDGFDKVVEGVFHLPEMHIGERLLWQSMGAYTTAASTTFNGFPQAQYYHYKEI